jgi:hypothetical protein
MNIIFLYIEIFILILWVAYVLLEILKVIFPENSKIRNFFKKIWEKLNDFHFYLKKKSENI